ncbi:MAG TPA: sugar ABC transporter permease [Clostridiaceae bacterium]|nr:sugar ABC transporter permease [Clostridiaceae bacterium]
MFQEINANSRNINRQKIFNYIKIRKIKSIFWGYLFILPALVFFIMFMVYPLIEAVILSFHSFRLNAESMKFVGFENYIRILKDPVFIKSLLNTFIIVLLVVPVTEIISLLLSELLIERSPKSQTFFRIAFYLPVVLSVVTISLVWKNMYSQAYGILNYLLSLIGIEPVNWLGNPRLVKFSLSVVIITFTLGQPIVLNLAALGSIPVTYYEAAYIDGASNWDRFWKITLPLIKPTTLYIIVTTTIKAFQVFGIIKIMTGGGPNYASSTVLYLIYERAFTFNDLAIASTMGVILFIVVAIFSAVQFKLMSGSVEY